jgi:hypothetical protein
MKYFIVFAGTLICLIMLATASIGLLVIVSDEDEIEDDFVSEITSALPSLSMRNGLENEGNGFTGQASAWIFGAANLPVGINLIAKGITRNVPLRADIKSAIERLNLVLKKYLMPFHTYLSILALALGVFHLFLSSCPNPFPELGLILMGILVGSGVIIKLKIAPKFLRKTIYQFHASLVISGVLLAVLFVGHVIMD